MNQYAAAKAEICRQCSTVVAENAPVCPNCGVSCPSKEHANGWGFEYKSSATLVGLPLIHVSFKYRANRRPVVAKGIIAIGQFACGLVTISQFGCGLLSLGQITLAGFAIAQFGVAYSLLAQFGIFFHEGHGQLVINFFHLLHLFG
jgi:hypothetical protein